MSGVSQHAFGWDVSGHVPRWNVFGCTLNVTVVSCGAVVDVFTNNSIRVCCFGGTILHRELNLLHGW